MKYTILFLAIVLASCATLPLKSNKISTRVKSNGEWSQFSDWQPINVDVEFKKNFFNFAKPKFIVGDQNNINLKLHELSSEDSTNSGESVSTFTCTDLKGDSCLLILVDKGDSVNAVIYYEDVNYCYNLYNKDKKKK